MLNSCFKEILRFAQDDDKMTTTVIERIMTDVTTIKQPPPVIALPIFLCLPDLVKGIPVLRENFCLALVMPTALFHEKPPLFIEFRPLCLAKGSLYLNKDAMLHRARFFGANGESAQV